ncbi:hypothetical protein LCGC14_1655790, partial [marine sediment metagenome]
MNPEFLGRILGVLGIYLAWKSVKYFLKKRHLA